MRIGEALAYYYRIAEGYIFIIPDRTEKGEIYSISLVIAGEKDDERIFYDLHLSMVEADFIARTINKLKRFCPLLKAKEGKK